MASKKKQLDTYLLEIFKQYIAIKDDDSKKSQEVFKGVFDQVKSKMGEKCNYFRKYSSQVLIAGSISDGIKVSKLDEFDMDLVIRLPINYEEIVIEHDQPGFVKLKIESAFDHLDKQKEWESCHKVTRDWRDSEKYLLQSKFRQWIHGIVQKALNDMDSRVVVNDVMYLLKYKESGPAWTLNIQNSVGDEEFKLDVDLVPVIRFRCPRWPEGYRQVEDGIEREWLVVPKPNKSLTDEGAKNRCWRLSFQNSERDMIKGCQQLKTAIRLVKKLRDSLQMKDIASYYIKTLFLWKIDEEKDKKYWQKSASVMFRIMVEELHKALVKRNIPYFWHEDNNLIQNLKPTVLKVYTDKLKEVLDAIDSNNCHKVAAFLLSSEEFEDFKKSEFYIQKQVEMSSNVSLTMETTFFRQESNVSLGTSVANSQLSSTGEDLSLADLIKSLEDKIDSVSSDNEKRMKRIESDAKAAAKSKPVIDLLKVVEEKLDTLVAKFGDQNEKLESFENQLKTEREQFNDKIEALVDRLVVVSERLRVLEGNTKNFRSQETNSELVFDNSAITLASVESLNPIGEAVLNLTLH